MHRRCEDVGSYDESTVYMHTELAISLRDWVLGWE